MRIGILGAGAIGMLFGGYLHVAGYQPLFITRTRQQAIQFREEGCVVQFSSEVELHFWPESYASEKMALEKPVQDIGLLLITVKQPSLVDVIPWINKHIAAHTPIICLMNGLGHQQELRQKLRHPLFFGITASGATKVKDNKVIERGRGATKIGRLGSFSAPNDGEASQISMPYSNVVKQLVEALDKLSIPCSYVPDMTMEMWKKCVINACINPLTALLQVRNGLLIEEKELHELMYQLYSELVPLIEVAHGQDAQKILSDGRLWQEIEGVCRITSENRSSMLQDIQHNRLTEIEAVTGYFLKEAKKYQLELPSHQFVYAALHFLQKKQTDRRG